MKNKINFLLTAILLCSSCSNHTLELNKEEEQLIENDIFLIKEIKSLNNQPWEDLGDLFLYESSQLKFSFFEGCTLQIQYYEYDGEGRISKIYHGGYFQRDDFDPSSFNIEEFKSSSDISVESYTYSGDNLIERSWLSYIFYHTYDGDNRLLAVEQFDVNNGEYYEKWTFNYNTTGIDSIERDNLDTGNKTIYTYEFDDEINPLYLLYQRFGLVDLETCRALDYSSADGYFFKNNVTKVYENDVLRYSATFEYKDDLPTRVSWIDYRFDQSNIELYTYE